MQEQGQISCSPVTIVNGRSPTMMGKLNPVLVVERDIRHMITSTSSHNQTRTALMATQQHLPNQVNQVGVCFVLSTTTAMIPIHSRLWLTKMYDGAKQTPLTPTASAAVDTKKLFSTFMPWMTTLNHC